MNLKLHRILSVVFAGGLLAGLSLTAYADSTDDIVNALVAKGVLTEEEGELIMKGHGGEKVMAEKKAKSNPTLEVGKKGLKVKSPDGDFEVKIGGRLHADYTSHSGYGDLPAGNRPINGTQIRRGRIALSGSFYKDFDYMIETDFANDATSVKDLFLVYHGFAAPMELTVGHQKHAMSMEVQESSNDIMFTERSLVSALTVPFFDRAIGANLKGFGENWNVQSGVYGDSMGTNATNASNNEGNGFGIRGTWAPVNEKDKVLHVGLNYGYRNTSDTGTANSNAARFRYRTTNMSELEIVDTGALTDIDRVKTGIFELAGMYGPLSFQSEFAKSKVTRDLNPDVDLSAWYAQAGWTLTGESRTYKGSDGEFKRLSPKNPFDLKNGKWGAWELAARYDQIDLDDENLTGGEAKRLSVSLNWYLNEDVRVLAGYSRAFNLDGGALRNANGSYADDIDVYTVRTQWAF
ncbi:MAG TPA: porin [Dyadobacter sp.]|nr:porin [Dyadobacter sp.]